MKRKNRGFTLAETLIVVAITVILMGVAFIAVQNHQRSMTRLEFDSIAKEIFVAAQNHLTSAQSQGYMDLSGDTALGTDGKSGFDTQGEHYFLFDAVHSYSSDPQTAASLLDLMLPFGSIDETVRAGGRYIIRYQPSSGRVLDVFYSLPGKSSMLTVSGIELAAGDYSSLMSNCRDTGGNDGKRARESFRGGNGTGIVGWYGGEEGLPTGKRLKDPEMIVHNEEVLWVEVKNNNTEDTEGSWKLIVTGATSGAQKSFDLSAAAAAGRIQNGSTTGTVKVILDDITTSGLHFADLGSDVTGKSFIPGEDVIIEAVAYNNSKLTNVAYSGKQTTNSLFADFEKETEGGNIKHVAMIDNFRHFENLDASVSGFAYNGVFKKQDGTFAVVRDAKQIKDLNWTGSTVSTSGQKPDSFIEAVEYITNVKPASIYLHSDSTDTPGSTGGCLHPTSPTYELDYDGQNHSVFNVKVNFADPAGMFGTLHAGSSVSNLELIDFDITATSGNAGALAGKIDGTTESKVTVTNVLAYNTTTGTDATITASGDAGGLIGSAENCDVTKCAAALVVSGSANAGGLIGSTTGGTVIASYSGGYTNKAKYFTDSGEPMYNVTASGKAGGLIGDAGNTEISSSYSTCSVKATDTTGGTAGGFVGAGGGSISGSYCTGLVSGATEGAFAGTAEIGFSATNCKYFEIINEIKKDDDGNEIDGYNYLKPLGNKTREVTKTDFNIKPFDADADSYDSFVGDPDEWQDAKPYDATLTTYYKDKYDLQTVKQLGASVEDTDLVATHYGDWPAPEEFVFN